VLVAWVFFHVTLLPAIDQCYYRIKVFKNNSHKMRGGTEKFGEWVIAPITGKLFTISVTGDYSGGVRFAFKNQPMNLPTAYFDQSTSFRQSTDFQQQP